MSYAEDLWMRSDLRGMAGLDPQRRRPDSSSQLNRGMIPKSPPISLHLPSIWTRDRINKAADDRGAAVAVVYFFFREKLFQLRFCFICLNTVHKNIYWDPITVKFVSNTQLYVSITIFQSFDHSVYKIVEKTAPVKILQKPKYIQSTAIYNREKTTNSLI